MLPFDWEDATPKDVVCAVMTPMRVIEDQDA